MNGLFIFRRDLRIFDNTAFSAAVSECKNLFCIFILTPEQIGPKNTFRSDNAIQFMMESLDDLNNQLHGKLAIFYGDNIKVIEKIKNKFDTIYFNNDYTPYSIKRDTQIKEWCQKNNKDCKSFEDLLLSGDMNSVRANNGNIYTKYTMFYKKALTIKTKEPIKPGNFESKIGILKGDKIKKYLFNPDLAERGGRTIALDILKGINKFKNYAQIRNTPSIQTTMLSAHLKFGTIGIRETYQAMKNITTLVQQLYWRDFYMYIIFNFPNGGTRPEFLDIDWNYSKEDFKKWCDGTTGCPIVDAGMRQMNKTGFMHNRARMIVATYLAYNLGIDWALGMKYFSQKLVDADWSNNVGNWQWTCGVEKWSNDYFKPMNMASQIARFDPECDYIKTWVPEVTSIPAKDLINWDLNYKKYPGIYYPPMDKDYKQARKDGIERYKNAIKKYTN